MRRLALALACLALGGCAVTGPKYEEIQTTIPDVSPGNARVYFFRTAGFAGGGVRPEIRLNDDPVGKSVPGSFFYVDRPAGKYVAAVQTEVERTLDLALQTGQTVYVRSYVTPGVLVGHAQLELASPGDWEQLRTGLTYIGDPVAPGAARAGNGPAPSSTPQALPVSAPEKTRMDDLRGLLPAK